jgi:hypothetical protein
VNQDQVDKFIEYFQTCWPQASAWDESQWAIWGTTLQQHGPSYVRVALAELIRDPRYAEFPPGLAAFIQGLDHAEAYERERLGYIDRQLRLDVAIGRTPADDPAALRAKMDQGRAARQHYIDRLMR